MALDARPPLPGAEGLQEDVTRQALLAGVLILNVALMLLPSVIALLILVGVAR
jgi:hypothetical protein